MQPYGTPATPWNPPGMPPPERPLGVTLLAILGFASSALAALLTVLGVIALLFWAGDGSHASGGGFLPGLERVFTVVMMAVVALGAVWSVVGLLCARGLWRQRNWARVVYLIGACLGAVSAGGSFLMIPNSGAALRGAIAAVPSLACNLAILVYLTRREVAATFS